MSNPDFKTEFNYKRITKEITGAFYLADGEFIVFRQPFRWRKNNEIICNAYEMFSLEQVCEDQHWEIVHSFGESIAICREKGDL